MRGKHHIMVQNSRLRYEMDIRRNITIIRGDSATGKTTLIQMLEQFSNLGEDSGIEVVCDKEIQILSGRNWKGMLDSLEDQILFIDEQNTFIKTEEFAAAVQDSSCYFVLVTREDLPNLPYSVEEIYGIHTSGKYHETRRIYNELYHLYSLESDFSGIRTDALVTEDSDSGFEFFNSLSEHRGSPCVSAQGKSNLPETAKQFGSQNILLIAGGAAIGPEMNSLYQMMQRNHRMRCYLF